MSSQEIMRKSNIKTLRLVEHDCLFTVNFFNSKLEFVTLTEPQGFNEALGQRYAVSRIVFVALLADLFHEVDSHRVHPVFTSDFILKNAMFLTENFINSARNMMEIG